MTSTSKTNLSSGVVGVAMVGAVIALACSAERPRYRMFDTPEDAARALAEAAKADGMDELLAIFGPEGQELVASSDPATNRRNRQIFTLAFKEAWHLEDEGTDRKTLVIGNEDWPFPVPLVKEANGWRFDTAAGKDEVLARRIGRNELETMGICRTYVAAQRQYAQEGHDGKPAGLYATRFRSEPGRHDGLYWEAVRGEKRSPLGDLVAQASEEGRTLGPDRGQPSPFHGYYFKILTAQGSAAPGGAKSYLVNGNMSGGFALVAWPAQYDATGIMTFIVNQEGVIHEKDLGPTTDAAGRSMTLYEPDASWSTAQ